MAKDLKGQLPVLFAPSPRCFPLSRKLVPSTLNMFDITYLHYHQTIEIGLCLSGTGICCVDNVEMPFKSGDVQIIFPYQHHLSKSERGQTSSWYWLDVNTDLLMATLGVTDMRPLQELISKRMALFGIFTKEAHPELVEQVTLLFQDAKETSNASLCACAARLWLVLLRLAQLSEDLPKLTMQRNPKLTLIDPALACIQQAVTDGYTVSIAQLAALCRMSEPNFRRVFRQAVGLSPHAYLQLCFLHKAERLLLTTDLSVSEISSRCGFEDVSGFNRLFRQSRGQSPSAYRRVAPVQR